MKEKWEEDAVQRFTVFLAETRGGTFGVTGRDVPVATGENFDYRVEDGITQKLAVEIYRLAEGEELATSAMWGRVVELLQTELEKRRVEGWVISTPLQFTVSRAQLAAFAGSLADQIVAALAKHADKTEFKEGGMSFRKADEVSGVLFMGMGEGGAVDPTGVAAKSLGEKLTKKNSQLGVADHEGILLIVNWVQFVSADEVVHVLALLNPSDFPNIDKIIFEEKEGKFHVVFDRQVTEAMSQGEFPATAMGRALLAHQLRYRLLEKDSSAFEFVKQMTEKDGGIRWLDDVRAREHLVESGEHVLKNGRLDDAMWIVRALRNDPDPEPESQFHKEVAAGGAANIITTVRGRLCWLIAHIIAQNRPEYYAELIGIVESYLNGPDLYVRVQACVPLEALMRRRLAQRFPDGRSFKWDPAERQRVKRIAFETLRDNASLPRVVEAVIRVFDAPRDFSEAEAEEISRIGLATGSDDVLDDVAAYIIYYALFRDQEAPPAPSFDSSRFGQILREQLVNGAHSTRSSLMWHLWKVIEQENLPYGRIQEFIDLGLAQPFEPGADRSFDLIIPELAKRNPGEARRVVSAELHRIEKYVEAGGAGQIWISWVEEMLPVYADHPGELVDIAARLERLWHRGDFVGDVATLARAFRLIQDAERRSEVEAHLKSMYARMRAAEPRLRELPED